MGKPFKVLLPKSTVQVCPCIETSYLMFLSAKIQIVFLKPIATRLFFVLGDGRRVQFCDSRAVYRGDRPDTVEAEEQERYSLAEEGPKEDV